MRFYTLRRSILRRAVARSRYLHFAIPVPAERRATASFSRFRPPLAPAGAAIQNQTITFGKWRGNAQHFRNGQGGSQYRRLIGAFQRVFGATIFFGTDVQREKAAVVHQARFNFMRMYSSEGFG